MDSSSNHLQDNTRGGRLLPLLLIAVGAAVVFLAAALANMRTTQGWLLAGILVGAYEIALGFALYYVRRSQSYGGAMQMLMIIAGLLVIPAVLANTKVHLDVVGASVMTLAGAVALAFAVRAFFNQIGQLNLTPVFLMFVIATLGGLMVSLVNPNASVDEMILAGIIGFILTIAVEAFLYVCFMACTALMRNRTTERIVISQIATVVRQNLPLATGLALAAEAEQGSARTHLRRIAHLLAQGLPLSEAVRRGYPDCSSLPLSLIVAGERAGQLATAVEQAEASLFERERRRPHDDMSIAVYVIIVTGFAALMVSGIMVAVVPKYKEIFKDFETMLPATTRSLIEVSEFVVNNPLGYMAPLVIVPLAVYWSVRPRRMPKPSWSSRMADWLRWHTPGYRRIEQSRNLSAALQAVRLGVQAGMGLPAAVRLSEALDVNTQLRPRMSRLGDLLDAGKPIRQATCEAGLDEVTGIALAGGYRAGDMDAALRYAVDYHGALASRWWTVLRSMTWPFWTLLMGILVGWIVVSLFQPLVALIDSVSM